MLAPIVTAYEHAMTEARAATPGAPTGTAPAPAPKPASYLAFLASIGYQLSAIEQAVADGTPYNGETPPEGLLTNDHDADPSRPARPR